jgi:5-methylcytosine-specific restriction endonuclease McrA
MARIRFTADQAQLAPVEDEKIRTAVARVHGDELDIRRDDRRLSREKRARRTRNSAAWQKARAAARQRDGNRCTACGSTKDLEVHHIRSLAEGGNEFALSNLTTLCRDCHTGTAGVGATRPAAHHTRQPVNRENHPGKVIDELLLG